MRSKEGKALAFSNFSISFLSLDTVKWIAIVAMFIDHFGLVVLDESDNYMRTIGRLAFPIFSYILVYNFIHYTSNKIRYITRLLIFASLSQPIYSFATGDYHINIIGLFAFSLFFLFLLEKVDEKKEDRLRGFLLFSLVFSGFMLSNFFDYGGFGFLIIVSFYMVEKFSKKYILLTGLLFCALYIGNIEQLLFSIIGVLLPFFAKKESDKRRGWKYFFYFFYPAHLLILLSFL